MEPGINSLLETIVLILAVTAPIAGAVLGFIRNKLSCVASIKSEQDNQKERSLRQSKGLITLGYSIDKMNNFQHPNNMLSTLGPEMETILKDEKGDL